VKGQFVSTAKIRQSPVTFLSVWTPRSSGFDPEPATRSLTVRHEHLTASGEGGHAGTDVRGDAAELRAHDLTLVHLQTGSNVQFQLLEARGDRARRADAPRGPVEGREKSGRLL
jgi:hypothetical protein